MKHSYDDAWLYWMNGCDYNIRASNREPVMRIIYSGFRAPSKIPGLKLFGPEYGRYMGEIDHTQPDKYRLELLRVFLHCMRNLRHTDAWLRQFAPVLSIPRPVIDMIRAKYDHEVTEASKTKLKSGIVTPDSTIRIARIERK